MTWESKIVKIAVMNIMRMIIITGAAKLITIQLIVEMRKFGGAVGEEVRTNPGAKLGSTRARRMRTTRMIKELDINLPPRP